MSLPSNQIQALFDLYNATDGINWDYYSCDINNQHWNFSQPEPNPCHAWCGVKCDQGNTTIVSLALDNYGLRGTISPSLDQLLDLQNLNLNDNYLPGTIPPSLIKLTKLVTFSVRTNELKGTLTSIFTNESALRSIDISYNGFIGKVPQSVKRLTNITSIDFSDNYLSGEIMDWLTAEQLRNIETLNLYLNQFSGTFPNASNLTSLVDLNVKLNNFIGTVPDIFYNNNKISSLSFSDNHFVGGFPPSLFRLPLLKYFVADNNYFTQRIEDINWTNMQRLSTLSIATNYLIGSFPSSLCRLNRIDVLALGFNLLDGQLSIPDCQDILYPSLIIFVLQGNFFSGPLHQIFNTTKNHAFTAVALSNNRLTGSIAADLFLHAPNLQVLAVGTNCLSGTIPLEICRAPILQAFSIDGASTSRNCRVPIVDIPSLGLDAFVTINQIHGTIPDCLIQGFSGSFLGLSGNMFTGTIPFFPADKATGTVFLSYNRLVGTIPLSWYGRTWASLDLSYNKLSGTFPSNSEIKLVSISTHISLQENRLSGMIPSIFKTTPLGEELNILQGNMLSCSFDKKELPKNDPNYETYTCGSNIVNYTLYLWLMVFLFALGVGFVWRVIRQIRLSSGEEGRQTLRTKGNILVKSIYQRFTTLFIDNSSQRYQSVGLATLSFLNYTLQIRRFSLVILLFIFVILLPIYAALGVFYRTYDERYAWTISATFLSGTQATIVLMVFFSIFIVFSIIIVHIMFKHSVRTYYRNKSIHSIRRISWKAFTMWSIAWMINLIIMGTADSVYVYLIISRSTKYEYLIQIILALFKLGWHDTGIFRMVYHLKVLFQGEASDYKKEPSSLSFSFSEVGREDDSGGSLPLLVASSHNHNSLSSIEDSSIEDSNAAFPLALTNQDIRYLSYMSIVNKVTIPCLAIFFISSNCFYNALVSPNPVTATYWLCYASSDVSEECMNILGSTDDGSSYTPAFNYSYQCSSAFLTDYVPVFVFMFLWSGVILPFLILLIAKIHELFDEEEGWFYQKIYHLSKAFLPMGWGEQSQSGYSGDIDTRLRNLILHRKQLLTLRIGYTLSVLFVFGSLFPPLALIAMIAVVNTTTLEEYLTKKMLQQSSERRDYSAYLEEECKDIDRSVFKVMRLILLMTCGLFGFLLFDVCGDKNGWNNGVIVMILMIVLPLLVYWTISILVKKSKSFAFIRC